MDEAEKPDIYSQGHGEKGHNYSQGRGEKRWTDPMDEAEKPDIYSHGHGERGHTPKVTEKKEDIFPRSQKRKTYSQGHKKMHTQIPWMRQGSQIYIPNITEKEDLSTVSVIHRTLTWTTGSLTCVRDHSYAWVYTQELGTPTAIQHNIKQTKNNNNSFNTKTQSNIYKQNPLHMYYCFPR